MEKQKEVVVPEDVFEALHIKKPEAFQKEVTLIFDKGQAIVRFPTFLTTELKLKKPDRVRVSYDSKSEPVKIICEIIRGK